MKRAIEFAERAVIIHRVIVDVDSELMLNRICCMKPRNFADLVLKLQENENVRLIDSEKEFEHDGDELFCNDDYWDDDLKNQYGE